MRRQPRHGDACGSGPGPLLRLRKVAPLRERLAGADAWVTGLRREQSPDARGHAEAATGTTSTASGRSTRSPTGPSRTSGATSSSTTCPTTRCTTTATRRSAARRARSPGAGREGRWAGTDKTECGLHGEPEQRGSMDPLVIALRPRRRHPHRPDRHRRRLADDAAADPRSSGSQPDRRHRHRPRLRRDHQDARRLAPPAQRAPSTSASRSGWRSARCPARSSACWLLDRLHDAYGDDFDDVLLVASSPARCWSSRVVDPRAARCSCPASSRASATRVDADRATQGRRRWRSASSSGSSSA